MSRNLKHIGRNFILPTQKIFSSFKTCIVNQNPRLYPNFQSFHDSHQRTNKPGEQINYEINFASRLCPSAQNFKLTIQHLLALPWSSLLSQNAFVSRITMAHNLSL